SGLIHAGFHPGDRFILYMPFTIEAVITYLALVKCGMVVVSVADSFSPEELKKRVEMTNAKAAITCDGYLYSGKWLPVYEKVKKTGSLKAIVVEYGQSIQLREQDLKYNDIR